MPIEGHAISHHAERSRLGRLSLPGEMPPGAVARVPAATTRDMGLVTSPRAEAPPAEADARPFIKIWMLSALVFVANALSIFGLNWWLAQVAGGAVLGVTIAAANLIALTVGVALAGAIDRGDSRRLLFTIKLSLVAVSLLLLPSYLVGERVAALVALAGLNYVVIETAQALYFAGLETSLVDLAPAAWASSRTSSLLLAHRHIARLVAPLIGGPLLVLGIPWSLPLVSAAAVALTCALWLQWSSLVPAGPRAHTAVAALGARAALRTALTDARVAAAWIRTQPVLVFMLVVAVTTNLIVFPFYSLLPVFLEELRVERHAVVYSEATMAYGVGVLVMTGVFVRLRLGRPCLVSGATVLLMAGVLATLTVVRMPAVIAAGMAVLGMGMMVLIAVAGGSWLDLTPSAIRVRVFSLRRLISFATIPLGTTVIGILGAAFGYVAVLRVLIGVVIVTLTLAACGLRNTGVR